MFIKSVLVNWWPKECISMQLFLSESMYIFSKIWKLTAMMLKWQIENWDTSAIRNFYKWLKWSKHSYHEQKSGKIFPHLSSEVELFIVDMSTHVALILLVLLSIMLNQMKLKRRNKLSVCCLSEAFFLLILDAYELMKFHENPMVCNGSSSVFCCSNCFVRKWWLLKH